MKSCVLSDGILPIGGGADGCEILGGPDGGDPGWTLMVEVILEDADGCEILADLMVEVLEDLMVEVLEDLVMVEVLVTAMDAGWWWGCR